MICLHELPQNLQLVTIYWGTKRISINKKYGKQNTFIQVSFFKVIKYSFNFQIRFDMEINGSLPSVTSVRLIFPLSPFPYNTGGINRFANRPSRLG